MKDIFKPNLALIAMSFIVAGVMTIKPLREALLNLLDVGLPVLAWAGFLLLSVVWSINYVKAARVSKARVTQNYKPTLLDYIRHGLPAIVVFSLGIGITLLIPNHLLQSNPFLPLLYILPLGGLLALWIWARVNDKIKF